MDAAKTQIVGWHPEPHFLTNALLPDKEQWGRKKKMSETFCVKKEVEEQMTWMIQGKSNGAPALPC